MYEGLERGISPNGICKDRTYNIRNDSDNKVQTKATAAATREVEARPM